MEASEALRRIFWRHRWLLLAFILVPVAIVVPARERQVPSYAASARIQGQGTTPDAATQVSAIQSRVTAVATDPALVGQAVAAAHVQRDANQVAQHEITVTPLGSSAVMVLTVTDRSRPVALSLAGSLARATANQLNQIATRDDPELTALNKAGLQLSAKRDKLVAELNAANAANQSTTSVEVQSLLAQLSAVEQQLASNQATVQQIIASLSASTGAAVVSVPVTATGVSRHTAADGALAALLGLVIGLLVATTREIIRPTIAQPGSAAAELGTVLLGNAETTGDGEITLADDLAVRLDVAARRYGACTVVLTGPVHPDRLAAIAKQLNGVLPDGPADAAVSSLWMRAPMSSLADHAYRGGQARPGAAEESSPAAFGGNHRAGARPGRPLTVAALPDVSLATPPEEPVLVVVVPPYAPRAGIDRVADLGATTDWPVLGVIGLLKRGRRGPRRHDAGPDATRPDATRPDVKVTDRAATGDTKRMGAVR